MLLAWVKPCISSCCRTAGHCIGPAATLVPAGEPGLHGLLASPFPHGVFELNFGPATAPSASDPTGQAANTAIVVQRQLQLLRMLKGLSAENVSSIPTEDVCQAIAKNVESELAEWLCGKQCLLFLDDVRSSDVVRSFQLKGFKGALLVTGLAREAWSDAPAEVEITSARVQPPCQDTDPAGALTLARRLLVSRALNSVGATAVPQGCEVS